MKTFSDNWKVVALYAAVALLILLPLLRPGYILTLDMVFTPRLRTPDAVTASYLFHVFLHVLNLIVPSQAIEKLLLFAVLFGSGVGMHWLARSLQSRHSSNLAAEMAAYASGLLYMANPYTYTRFMAGQYSVLLGYACLPFFVMALLRFLGSPSVQRCVVLAAWAVGISIVSIHTLGLMLLVALVAVGQAAWRRHTDMLELRRLAKYCALAVLIFLASSSYWLVPLLRGTGDTATAIDTFRSGSQAAFATVGNGTVGKLLHVLRLQGFWGEGQDMYLLPQDQLGAWWALFVVCVWGAVAVGVRTAWRQRREVLVLFGLSAVFAVLLAAGVGTGWLSAHVPLFAGYREPQKFAGVVALGFAVFVGFAFCRVFEATRSRISREGVVAALLTVIVGFTPVMFGGFDGQLVPRQYPADWYTVNRLLDKDHGNFQVLFLPWHLYMRYRFAGRVIANPGTDFFDKPTLISNDPEFKDVAPAVPNAGESLLTTRILPRAHDTATLGRQLAPFGVKYVLLAKDLDYQSYGYLDHQTDLKLITETATLKLYRNVDFGKNNP